MHQALPVEKLIANKTISMLVTSTSQEILQKLRDLDQVPQFYYPILFPKNIGKVEIID